MFKRCKRCGSLLQYFQVWMNGVFSVERHYFFAIDIPDDVALQIDKWCRKLNRECFRNWVHPKDYHITLAFLGAIKSEGLKDSLTQAISSVVQACQPFSLTITGVSTFGEPTSPRVCWLGVEESSSLQQLRERVYEVCKTYGFQLDKRPFTPHITIARKWVGQTKYQPKQQIDVTGQAFLVKDIYLFETHPNMTPKYKRIEAFQMYGERNE